MFILNKENYNILAFPKVGCTFLIKLCTIGNIKYKNHGHKYQTNQCKKHKNIHQCGNKNSKYDKNKQIIVFYRFPHERILSFYYGNYNGNAKLKLSLEEFVNKILVDQNFLPGLYYHTYPIIQKIREHVIFKNKKIIYYHLKELNNTWKTIFKKDISNIEVNNKSGIYEKMNDELIKKIRKHPHWKGDYDYFETYSRQL